MRTFLSTIGLGTLCRRMLGVRLGRYYQYQPKRLSVSTLSSLDKGQPLPTIVLVTPSFNQAEYIRETIESVLGQDYPELHYIIQDAGSTDGTGDILEGYRVRGVMVHIEGDFGQADALNRGFSRASGEVMGYLNSDDLFLPGTLHLVGRYFHDHPEVDVIYGNRLIVDEAGREVGRWILPDHDPEVLRFTDYIPQESMFWRRRIWDAAGAGFDANLHFAMDWELLLRFLDAGAVFAHVPGLFGIFRVHERQKSQANFTVRGAQEMAGLRSRCKGHLFRRLVLHGSYLHRHIDADAAFMAGAQN